MIVDDEFNNRICIYITGGKVMKKITDKYQVIIMFLTIALLVLKIIYQVLQLIN